MQRRNIGLLAITLWISSLGYAHSTDYVIGQASGHDTVFFRSSAKLEFIEGVTHDIVGDIILNPDSATTTTGLFRVDLRTLKSDIDLRDEHMRVRHLETDKYPYAYFTISSIADCPPILKPDTTYNLRASGKFYIHGVWRAVQVSAEVRRQDQGSQAGMLSVRATFALKLDDFGIPRPKALFLKLAEVVNIEVIFTAANNLPVTNIALPDWPERK